MMGHTVSSRRLLTVLACLGGLPALVILLLIRFDEGQLVVSGQAMAEYDLPRLTATLISLLLPVFLVLPMALGHLKQDAKSFVLTGLLAPLCLFLPGVLAGFIVGGRSMGSPMTALILLCVLQICLCLWMRVLTELLGFGLAVVAYGAAWGISGYMDHLRLYVLPYLEFGWAAPLGYANWLLPQVKSGPSLVDDYLAVGELLWSGLGPTLIQIPILLAVIWVLNKRNASPDATPA